MIRATREIIARGNLHRDNLQLNGRRFVVAFHINPRAIPNRMLIIVLSTTLITTFRC